MYCTFTIYQHETISLCGHSRAKLTAYSKGHSEIAGVIWLSGLNLWLKCPSQYRIVQSLLVIFYSMYSLTHISLYPVRYQGCYTAVSGPIALSSVVVLWPTWGYKTYCLGISGSSSVWQTTPFTRVQWIYQHDGVCQQRDEKNIFPKMFIKKFFKYVTSFLAKRRTLMWVQIRWTNWS
jgi:hypothetical protein